MNNCLASQIYASTNYNIKVYNILRHLGLCPKLKGTKILLSAIIVALNYKDDFIVVSDIYKQLSIQYKISIKTIENSIAYSLKHLVHNKFEENFEKIIGIEFCEDYYSNKTIIEEITRIIKIEIID